MTRVLEGRNRATADEAASFAEKLIEIEDRMESLRMGHLSELAKKLKPLKDEAKELLDDAKSQGVNKGVVKAVAKARKFERKAEEAIDELEDDDRQFAVDIRAVLGSFADTPLGAAAVEAGEGKSDPTTQAIVDAVQADEAAKAAEAGADSTE